MRRDTFNQYVNHLVLGLQHFFHYLVGDKHIASKLDVVQFNAQYDNTYLVSFPRTGSHWLRMLIELYFERPLLTRSFFYPSRKDYLLLHSHDMDLQVRRRNVIYLFRNPVDTVYSQLNYYREDINNTLAIVHWSQRYACHLAHWLVEEQFTTHKTVVQYERLKKEPQNEFEKIANHFGEDIDVDKLERCLMTVSKQEVKQKTEHDNQVVNLQKTYEEKRTEFRVQSETLVRSVLRDTFETVYSNFNLLPNLFPESER